MNAKPALNPRPSKDNPGEPQLKSLKLKVPKAKGELLMVKEVLKNAQDEAQEVQKRVWEETKKLKKRGRELGVHDRIKAVNDGENGKALSLHPPHVSGLSRTGSKIKISPHQNLGCQSLMPQHMTPSTGSTTSGQMMLAM